MRNTSFWPVLASLPMFFAVAACERRDGQNAESGAPPITPAPLGTSTRTRAPIPTPPEREATPAAAVGTDVSAWEGRRSGRVTFVPTPEPAGFPTGAFRAATKMCLEEVHAPAEMTLELTLATQGGRVRTVNKAGGLSGDGSAGAGATSPLVACLQRLYAKITVAGMPARFSAAVSVAPAAD